MVLDEIIEVYRRLVEELGPDRAAELFHRLFRSRGTAYALALLSTGKAMSASDLQDMGTPEASAYRTLKDLRRLGLIEPGEMIQASRGGGPKTRVWRLKRDV